MSDITRIAICGQLRSGKSLIAEHLQTNKGFKIISFGSRLKQAADELFAYSEVYKPEIITAPCPFGGKREIGRKKPRRLYQDFGEALRALDGDIWITHAEQAMKAYELFRDTKGIVLDDLRQPRELEWARANGYTIIRVTAPENVRVERATALGDDFDTESLTHETEMHVDGFEVDYEITNDGSKAELLARVDEIVDETRAKGGRYDEI